MMTPPARVPARVLTRLLAVLALLAPALAAGCGADFDPYNRLTKLRVLAIRSEPPAPAAGETAILTPLLYIPDGDPPVAFQWSWCPAPGSASEGYPCLVTAAELAQGGASVPPFELGSGATAAFMHTVDPALLQGLCGGIPGALDKPDCAGGFPVQVKLTLTSASAQVTTVLTLRLRFDPSDPPNRNPRVDGLEAMLEAGPQPIGDEPAVVLPRQTNTTVRAAVPEEDAERYPGLDAAGDPAEVRERLTLSWFVESGDLDDGRTGFIEGVTDFATAVTTRWKPASEKDYPRDASRIVVVVRDNRGGVAWRTGAVRLGAAP
jgi:hypothetical protein